MTRLTAVFLVLFLFLPPDGIAASEVIPETSTDVRVRLHPKTGKSFVSITSLAAPEQRYPFPENVEIYSRPDYRMLDHRIKSGDIPYDGPYSSSTKIYIFAASMATAGAAAAALAPVGAAAGAGAASGSAAGPLVGGAAVVAGVAGAYTYAASTSQHPDNFIQRAEAKLLKRKQSSGAPVGSKQAV